MLSLIATFLEAISEGRILEVLTENIIFIYTGKFFGFIIGYTIFISFWIYIISAVFYIVGAFLNLQKMDEEQKVRHLP